VAQPLTLCCVDPLTSVRAGLAVLVQVFGVGFRRADLLVDLLLRKLVSVCLAGVVDAGSWRSWLVGR